MNSVQPSTLLGLEESRPTVEGTTEIKGKFLDENNKLVWKQLEDGNCKKYPIYYTPYDQKVGKTLKKQLILERVITKCTMRKRANNWQVDSLIHFLML